MSRYIKYALGEIILVMFGILLALQVNNWNEERKLTKTESVYLKGLKEDFLISQKALNRVIIKTKRVAQTVSYLIDIIKVNPNEMNSINMDSLIISSGGYTIFMDSQGVIKDILGSGQLGLIKNPYLRKEIASWEANLKMIRARETLGKERVNVHKKNTQPYLDLANLEYNKHAFITSKIDEFRQNHLVSNALADILNNSNLLNRLYKDKQKHIDTLIQVIDKELNTIHD